jgi:uncharacterized OB-fold protein
MTAVAIEASLFASLDPPTLLGSRCDACGTVAFPVAAGCAKCASTELSTTALPTRGTLWSWTIQALEPKAPYRTPAGGFQPYGVGYVHLGEVIVESRLLGDLAEFSLELPMQLTLTPLWSDEAGHSVVTYAFAPAGDPS